jgi:hypothetical protein
MLAPRSLQNRLLLSFLLSMLAIFTMGGFVIYPVISRHLHEEHDDLLRDRLNFYAGMMNIHSKRGVPSAGFLLPDAASAYEWERVTSSDNPDLMQAWYVARGTPLPTKSESLRHKTDQPRNSIPEGEVAFMDYNQWDGRPARLCTRVFVPPRKEDPALPDIQVQLVVGRDLTTLQKTLSDVRWFVIKIGLAVMGGILVASLFIIRRGVRPVNSLTHQIEVMPLAEEGAHFSLPGAPTELQPVVARLNALMDRVTDAIELERQFANNADH